VTQAERGGKSLNQLSVKELQAIDKNFGPEVVEIFDLAKAMERRNLAGAPSRAEVQRQLARWREIFNATE